MNKSFVYVMIGLVIGLFLGITSYYSLPDKATAVTRMEGSGLVRRERPATDPPPRPSAAPRLSDAPRLSEEISIPTSGLWWKVLLGAAVLCAAGYGEQV